MSRNDNDEKLLESAKNIRRKFKTELADKEDSDLSYLDELNAHIRHIFKDDPADVYTTLSREHLERWKKKRFKRWIAKTFKNISPYRLSLFALLSTITGFLVSEALDFYAINSAVSANTYVKAILTEVCFIFLSGYRANNKLETAAVSVLRVSIFTLMVFVISSQTFTIGTKNISETLAIKTQIKTIQLQISEKEEQIKYYQSINWPRNYTTARLEKEKLVDKLLALQEQQAKGKNESVSYVEEIKMYGKAAFRVILLLISVLITRRLFKF